MKLAPGAVRMYQIKEKAYSFVSIYQGKRKCVKKIKNIREPFFPDIAKCNYSRDTKRKLFFSHLIVMM